MSRTASPRAGGRQGHLLFFCPPPRVSFCLITKSVADLIKSLVKGLAALGKDELRSPETPSSPDEETFAALLSTRNLC